MRRVHEFTSDPCALAGMRAFARGCLEGGRFSEEEVDLMVLGLDEACANVIRHAYGGECGRAIRLEYEAGETGVRFALRDYGGELDPGCLCPRSLDEPRPGGLGLHLIRKAFDTVEYVRRDPGTELVLEKRGGGR